MRRELSEAEQQSVSDIAAQLLVQSYRQDLSPDLRESLNTHTIYSFIPLFFCQLLATFGIICIFEDSFE